ncbi:MAG TPA: hypothetical protein VLC93_12645 [Myxococcota bacterium]|nr:hypothetical protein [Myxococcota bacterium]
MDTLGPVGLRAQLLGTTALSATASARATIPSTSSQVDRVERVGKRAPHAGDVIAWHDFATTLITKVGLDDLMGAQRLAVAVQAQMNALALASPNKATIANAAIGAVLTNYFPTEIASIHVFAAKLGLPLSPIDQAVALAIAGKSIAARVGDGSDDDRPITIPEGKWVPKDPNEPPFRPRWGAVRMWTAANDAVTAPPPPAEGSDIFAINYRLSRNSYDVRQILDTDATPELKEQGRSFAASTELWKNLKPWNDVLVAEIKAREMSPQATAKLLFAFHTARADAYVAVFKAKYDPMNGFVRRPWQIEPADPIKEAVKLPNTPAYPSAHAGQGGAISALLNQVFPEKKKQWLAMASGARASRIVGGLSYLSDMVSTKMGETVATNVMRELGIVR